MQRVRTCMRACVRACVREGVQACVREGMCACVCGGVREDVRTHGVHVCTCECAVTCRAVVRSDTRRMSSDSTAA